MLTTLIIDKDEVLKMAKQAGFNLEFDDYVYEHWNSFQAFAKLVAEKSASVEREACARVCDVVHMLEVLANPAEKCAKVIRARGEPTLRGEA
jgi:hypothetical protein